MVKFFFFNQKEIIMQWKKFFFLLFLGYFCVFSQENALEKNIWSKKRVQEDGSVLDISQARARWISHDSLIWKPKVAIEKEYVWKLYYHPSGKIGLEGKRIRLDDKGGSILLDRQGTAGDGKDTLSDKALPYLSYLYGRDRLVTSSLYKQIPGLLKQYLVVALENERGDVMDATSVQLAGILDDLYSYDGRLGIFWEAQKPVFHLWAPTALSVKLHIYKSSQENIPEISLPMLYSPDSGVWKARGDSGWKGKFYLYEVEVFVRSTGQVESNLVTDPYSISLSINSKKSQIVDLKDNDLKPQGWNDLVKPALRCASDIVLYELHIRDFSIYDDKIKAEERGTFLAFDNPESIGIRHLKKLSDSGITHVHLLPSFDIATIEEERSKQNTVVIPENIEPDSEIPQKLIAQIKDQDGFNWGYDPFHYMTPEGSYSTNPDGSARITEFRRMVQGLNRIGLRVILDVVFNHTHAAGQEAKSVLDRIVPGYYYRLDDEGNVPCSTCCPDLATEHAMMEKLMCDALVLWAREYKVDGFRFDLMGHHTTSNLRKIREALSALNFKDDGVDGKEMYLYGEAWEFGSLNAMIPGEACHQQNTYRLGVGSFNDRLRDAVRGGNPFCFLSIQGFCNGLYYDFNDVPEDKETSRDKEVQKGILLNLMDNIRIGMAGNLREYHFTSSEGKWIPGKDVHYKGRPGAGYTASPVECINYVSVHDNHTLWDNIQAKAAFHTKGRNPETASVQERVRMSHIALSIVALGQGIPLFHAGDEILRSKSGDRDSYNSGDYFNRLDFSYQSNNWGIGLPIAEKNQEEWNFWRKRLSDPELKATPKDIEHSLECFCELLKIRKSSPLFRLQEARDIQKRVHFLNAEKGKDQIPGLIVMALLDNLSGEAILDSQNKRILCAINATREEISFSHESLKNGSFLLHSVLIESHDENLQKAQFDSTTGTIRIPAQSTIVFCEKRE